ncbi:ABC transporter substrate-binding protein [Diplocloster hominis]|uniref:ABC transporter substrate-binding protein n=1 Tax=Diplocloster hominis TaxID=3079010 RepID=UPI0031BB5C3A
MWKKTFAAALAVVMAAGMMTGCGKTEAPAENEAGSAQVTAAPQEEQKAAPADGEEVTLSFMLPQTHYKDFVKDLTAQFEEENPGYKIDVQAIPDNQWIDLVKTKVAVEETPDIIRIDKSLMLEVGEDNFLEMTEEQPWYSRAIESQMEPKMIDGKLYGMPASGDTAVGLLYNKKLFDENNVKVPANTAELYEACEIFKEKGITPVYASDKDTWTTQVWFTGAAPQVVPEETFAKLMSGEVTWTDVPEFEDVIAKMGELREKGYTNADFMAATYDSAQAAMANGEAAMYVSGQFAIGDIQKINPDVDIRMSVLPYEKDVLAVSKGPGQFSIFKNSKNVEAAEKFLDWMSQPEHMDIFLAGWGEYPLFKDQKMELPAWQQDLNDGYMTTGNTAVETNSLLTGIDLNDFWSYQQEMLTGSITAKEVMEKWDVSFADQAKAKGMEGF